MTVKKQLPEYNFSKSTVERYSIRSNGEWGEFVLIESGALIAYTSFGEFAGQWSLADHEDFKDFLITKISKPNELLKRMIGDPKNYDSYKIIDNLINYVLKQRKAKVISEITARNCYEILKQLDEMMPLEVISQELFVNNYIDIDPVIDSDNFKDFIIYEYSETEKRFAEEMCPMLAEVLKEELEDDNQE